MQENYKQPKKQKHKMQKEINVLLESPSSSHSRVPKAKRNREKLLILVI
jgi:hypothetical protein